MMKRNMNFCVVLFACAALSFSADARKKRDYFLDFKIVIYGDTFSAGYQVERRDTYPFLLRKMLNSNYDYARIEVVNASVEGDTATSAAARLQSILAEKPNIVVVALGGTDIMQGIHPGTTERALGQILNVLTHNNIYTLLVGSRAPDDSDMAHATAFNMMFPRLAEQYHLTFIPDLLEGVRGEWDKTFHGGVYPDEDGHRHIANRMYDVLADMFIKLQVNHRLY